MRSFFQPLRSSLVFSSQMSGTFTSHLLKQSALKCTLRIKRSSSTQKLLMLPTVILLQVNSSKISQCIRVCSQHMNLMVLLAPRKCMSFQILCTNLVKKNAVTLYRASRQNCLLFKPKYVPLKGFNFQFRYQFPKIQKKTKKSKGFLTLLY